MRVTINGCELNVEVLGPEVVGRSQDLLRADHVHLYLIDSTGERLHLRWRPAPRHLQVVLGHADDRQPQRAVV